ncbi:MAG TPA: histidine kinase [Chryseosolibacter sp.]|nr:histidine kinase [Chryseosolibacter sp.]
MITLSTALPSLLFYSYLFYSETGRLPNLQNNIKGFAVAIIAGIVIGSVLYVLNRLLNGWIKWINYFTSRFLVGLITNVIIAFGLIVGLASIVLELWHSDVFWNDYAVDDPDVMLKIAILTIVYVFIYNVIYGLLYAYQHYAVAQIQELQRDRKQLELQFEALKGQISPHYLFNSLNTISSLVIRDVQSAEQFIRRLAQTYQYVLSTQNKKYVSLREELEFVQSYYYLLRIRFQQQLDVEVNVPSKILDSRIPPLTLQMLIENAVKHNSFTDNKKLFIYIMAQDHTYLRVINTKTGMLDNVPSFKVGLENIRQRYHFLTDKQVLIENDEKFTVSLPVLNQWDENAERKHSA